MDNRTKIRSYIEANLITFNEETKYEDDDNIFTRGIVNSLFAMKLLTFIEDEFAIEVSNDEMDISNFSSVNSILNFIDKKLAAK